jgi:hypothetical protein
VETPIVWLNLPPRLKRRRRVRLRRLWLWLRRPRHRSTTWYILSGGSSNASLVEDEEWSRGVLSEQKTSLLRYNRRVAGFSAGMPMRLYDHSQYS